MPVPLTKPGLSSLKCTSQAWKALILRLHPDNAHHTRGIKETLALCALDPPVTDPETLNLLQKSLDGIEDGEVPNGANRRGIARTLWEKAVKKKPGDEKLQLRWYQLSAEKSDWKSAQQVRYTTSSTLLEDAGRHQSADQLYSGVLGCDEPTK